MTEELEKSAQIMKDISDRSRIIMNQRSPCMTIYDVIILHIDNYLNIIKKELHERMMNNDFSSILSKEIKKEIEVELESMLSFIDSKGIIHHKPKETH